MKDARIDLVGVFQPDVCQVRYLEKATYVNIVFPKLPTPGSIDISKVKHSKVSKRALTSSYSFNWGDVRMSHRLKSAFLTNTSYIHDDSAGAGAWIYVVDTGINLQHQVSFHPLLPHIPIDCRDKTSREKSANKLQGNRRTCILGSQLHCRLTGKITRHHNSSQPNN